MDLEEKVLAELDKVEGASIISIIAPSEEYFNINTAVLSHLSSSDRKSLYVTLNKPFQALQETLGDNGVDTDTVFFIDAISKTVGIGEEAVDNCIFLDHPSALTQINIVLKEAIEEINPDFLVIDSLSTLLLYNKEKSALKFIHKITGLVRENEVSGIIFSLEEDIGEDTIASINQFCDKIIEL